MLHRMPQRYQRLVWAAGLLSFAGLGLWAGLATPLPVMWAGGALLGVLLGVGAVTAFLHALNSSSVDTLAQRRTRAG